MEEQKKSGIPFTILSARNYAKFHLAEFLVAVPFIMAYPVHDLCTHHYDNWKKKQLAW